MSEVLHVAPVYWCGPIGPNDDFGATITDEFIDGATKYGPWANMTPDNWAAHGRYTALGTGMGQRYKLQADGRWLKVEG